MTDCYLLRARSLLSTISRVLTINIQSMLLKNVNQHYFYVLPVFNMLQSAMTNTDTNRLLFQ